MVRTQLLHLGDRNDPSGQGRYFESPVQFADPQFQPPLAGGSAVAVEFENRKRAVFVRFFIERGEIVAHLEFFGDLPFDLAAGQFVGIGLVRIFRFGLTHLERAAPRIENDLAFFAGFERLITHARTEFLPFERGIVQFPRGGLSFEQCDPHARGQEHHGHDHNEFQ